MASSSYLDCSICFNPFTDPRLLPCLHVYCKSCLDSLELQNEGTLTCPSCYKTSIRSSSLLSTHIKIERDVSVSKLQKKADKAICGTCDDNNKAEAYCEDCASPICSKCVTIHSVWKAVKTHKVVSLQSPPPRPTAIPVPCSVHPSETLKYYCSTCELLTCSDCVLNHKDHNWNRIEEVVDEERKALGLVVEKVQEFNHVVTKAIENVDSFLEHLSTCKNNVIDEINKSFDKLSAIVEERRAELLTELEETAIAKTTQLQIQKELLENASSYIRLVAESGTQANSTEYSDAEVLAVSGSIQDAGSAFIQELRLIDLHPVTNCTLSYDIQEELEAISMFGNIRNHSHYAPLCSLVGINPSLAVGVAKGCKSTLTLQTRDRKGEDLTEGGASVKGRLVSCTPDKLLTIDCEVNDFDNGKYEMNFAIDNEGEFILEITIDGISIQPEDSPLVVWVRDYSAIKLDRHCGFYTGHSPAFIDVGLDSTIYLCTKTGIEVYKNKRKLKEIPESLIWHKALTSGIAVDEQNGFMFVANMNSNEVIKLSLDGKVMASISSNSKGCSNSVNFSRPMGLCLTKPEHLLLIGDVDNKKVLVLDGCLSLIHSISCLADIWGVAVDNKGNIHAAAADRVEVFSTDGEKICEYGKGQLQRAFNVTFLKTQCHQNISYSFVSDHKENGGLYIFDWLKDTVVHFVKISLPTGVAIDQKGMLYVCRFDKDFIYEL